MLRKVTLVGYGKGDLDIGRMSRSAKNKIYIHSGFTVGAASPGRSQETCGFQSVVYTKLGGFLNLK